MLSWTAGIERVLPSPERVLANELQYWPVFGQNWKQAIDNGEAMRIAGRNPQALVRLLSDQARIDSYLAPILSEFRLACAEPFPAAAKRLHAIRARTEPLQRRSEGFGLHVFEYLVDPERVFLEMLLGSTLPPIDRMLIMATTTRAFLRGGALTVALHAFHQEKTAWPSSLAELETQIILAQRLS